MLVYTCGDITLGSNATPSQLYLWVLLFSPLHQDLARSLAINCLVFNCSDDLDYISMGQFFSGIAASGSWACFDEFNRLEVSQGWTCVTVYLYILKNLLLLQEG